MSLRLLPLALVLLGATTVFGQMCGAGLYRAVPMNICMPCDGNFYSPDNDDSCHACPTGQVTEDHINCHCPGGTYPTVPIAGCAACDDNYISPNGLRCDACPTGQTSEDHLTCHCPMGQYIAVPMLVCSACLGNAYGDGINCHICPIGKVADALHYSCSCPAGTYTDASIPEANGQCVACAGNTIGNGSSTCTDCPAGTAPNSAHTQCVVVDVTPPNVTGCPSSTVQVHTTTDVNGAVVTWNVGFVDDIDDSSRIIVQTDTSPACGLVSGSTFPLGTTSVFVTGTDASGNVAECSFDVEVTCGNSHVGNSINLCHIGGRHKKHGFWRHYYSMLRVSRNAARGHFSRNHGGDLMPGQGGLNCACEEMPAIESCSGDAFQFSVLGDAVGSSAGVSVVAVCAITISAFVVGIGMGLFRRRRARGSAPKSPIGSRTGQVVDEQDGVSMSGRDPSMMLPHAERSEQNLAGETTAPEMV